MSREDMRILEKQESIKQIADRKIESVQYVSGYREELGVPENFIKYFTIVFDENFEMQISEEEYRDVFEYFTRIQLYISRDVFCYEIVDSDGEEICCDFITIAEYKDEKIAIFEGKENGLSIAISHEEFRKLQIMRGGILSLNQDLNRFFNVNNRRLRVKYNDV